MMKAFISVDLEGMPFVVIPNQLHLKGSLYNEARQIATKITLSVADELNKNGFDKVLIADSHGPMVNILIEDLPEYTEIIRGFPRPLSMIAGINECDVALFLGYHAKFGTSKATFDHTYSSSTIRSLEMNGIVLSEFLLNSYAAGDLNVPVILVAGDESLVLEDVEQYAPWVEKIILKQAFTRLSAKSSNLTTIQRDLKAGVQKACLNFSNNKNIKILKMDPPINTKITFLASHFADIVESLPNIKRIDPLTIKYTTINVLESYRIFESLVLACIGMKSIIESLE